jgi:hypothetical protein
MSKKTKIINLPKELQSDIYSIIIDKNPYLVGTGSITSLTYNSDYDVNEILNIPKMNRKKVLQHISNLNNVENIWLMNYTINDDYIQINTICNINGVLTDVNDTIFSKKMSLKDKSEGLKDDIKSLVKEGNYFKAVKRMYSLITLDPKPTKQERLLISFLTEFLNSNIGLLSSIINQLNIIKEFISISPRTKQMSELIFNNLEMCKLSLNHIYVVNIQQKYFSMFTIKKMNMLIKSLNKLLQNYTKQWVEMNKHLLIF